MTKRYFTSQDDSPDSHPGVTKEEIDGEAYLFRKSKGIAHQLLILGHGVALSDTDYASVHPNMVWLGPDRKLLSMTTLQEMMRGQIKYHSLSAPQDPVLNYTVSKWPGHNPLRVDSYYSIKSNIEGREFAIDVLTIRNRWFSSSLTLADILAMLRDRRYTYGNIICQFCRGRPGMSLRNDHTPYENPPHQTIATLGFRNYNV